MTAVRIFEFRDADDFEDTVNAFLRQDIEILYEYFKESETPSVDGEDGYTYYTYFIRYNTAK